MEETWQSSRTDFERIILAGDAGGTNTSIALFGNSGREFTPILKCRFKSGEISSFLDPVAETLDAARRTNPKLTVAIGCISSAGPVVGNVCKLTNVPWAVDGGAITKRFGFPALVVNDFVALSYGMPLLHVDDAAQITKVPHSDGSVPAPAGERLAVVGAGTGLGTGLLTEAGGRYIAIPAEGGHSDFAPANEEMLELWRFVRRDYSCAPGTEAFVSGRGITNVYRYYRSIGKIGGDAARAIDAAPESEKPALIAGRADDSPECRTVMDLFIRMYGHYAARAALMYIPMRGMFLAGGIVEKNERLFLEDHRFAAAFETNYRDNIHALLMSIPIYIVRDYATSLSGAANAARSLLL